MGIFDGLEALGFGNIKKEIELFKKQEKETTKTEKHIPEVKEEDYLYAKECVCPVCDKKFTDYIVRKSKLRLANMDSDLKANYMNIDPNRYDVLLCHYCGYAALHLYFNRISDRQIDLILAKIKPYYKPKEYPVVLTAENAVERYKMALLSAVTKGSKASEKAIICLKIGWLYRDLNDKENELLFLKNAVEGLKEAYSVESFPLGSMDENTTLFMLGELSRRLGNYKEASRWIGTLVVRRNLSKNLKDRALTTKERIFEETKKMNEVK